MPAIFIKCEKYNYLKKKNYIIIFWKAVDRVIN